MIVTLSTALLATGCSSGSSRDRATPPPPEEESVGEGLLDETTNTTAAAAAIPEGASDDPAPPAGAAKPGVAPTTTERGPKLAANQAQRDDASGFRLLLTVDSDSSEARFELAITNRTDRTLRYDSNELNLFSMRRGPDTVWRDTDCRQFAPSPMAASAIEVAPGEEQTFQAKYPSRCKPLPAGSYQVIGGFRWCPDQAHDKATNGCDPARSPRVESTPVILELG